MKSYLNFEMELILPAFSVGNGKAIRGGFFAWCELPPVEPSSVSGPMNAVAPRRNLAKSLEAIADFVSANPADAPAEFVRELARCWKERGGPLAGKPRHSDRYLDELLRKNDSPIRSLTPKLGGRTNLKPADASILVIIFLSHWTYKGDPYSGEIAVPSSNLYEPLLSDAESRDVSAYVAGRISAVAEQPTASETAPTALRGRDTVDLIVSEFKDAEAMFVVGAGQTMLVDKQETALIRFRDLMNSLWKIEQADRRGRILVWMLELGRKRFEDLESRSRFMNVGQVLLRFRALKQLTESAEGESEDRWNWLRSRVVFVLHDTSSDHPPSAWLPNFDAHHVLFSAVPPRWVNSRSFRILYAGDDDRMSEDRMLKANYTIFMKKVAERPHYELRYFGNALLSDEKGESQVRGLELNPPGESYTEALGTVYVAAAQLLELSGVPAQVSIDKLKIGQAHAKEKLQHHGFLLLGLDEFMAS